VAAIFVGSVDLGGSDRMVGVVAGAIQVRAAGMAVAVRDVLGSVADSERG
jgi:hypothetical protein